MSYITLKLKDMGFKGTNLKRVRYLHEVQNLVYELKGI